MQINFLLKRIKRRQGFFAAFINSDGTVKSLESEITANQ